MVVALATTTRCGMSMDFDSIGNRIVRYGNYWYSTRFVNYPPVGNQNPMNHTKKRSPTYHVGSIRTLGLAENLKSGDSSNGLRRANTIRESGRFNQRGWDDALRDSGDLDHKPSLPV